MQPRTSLRRALRAIRMHYPRHHTTTFPVAGEGYRCLQKGGRVAQRLQPAAGHLPGPVWEPVWEPRRCLVQYCSRTKQEECCRRSRLALLTGGCATASCQPSRLCHLHSTGCVVDRTVFAGRQTGRYQITSCPAALARTPSGTQGPQVPFAGSENLLSIWAGWIRRHGCRRVGLLAIFPRRPPLPSPGLLALLLTT